MWSLSSLLTPICRTLSVVLHGLGFRGAKGENNYLLSLIQSIFIDYQLCTQNCSELFRNTKAALGSARLKVMWYGLWPHDLGKLLSLFVPQFLPSDGGRIKWVDVLKILVQHLAYNWCLINCHGDDGSSGGWWWQWCFIMFIIITVRIMRPKSFNDLTKLCRGLLESMGL